MGGCRRYIQMERNSAAKWLKRVKVFAHSAACCASFSQWGSPRRLRAYVYVLTFTCPWTMPARQEPATKDTRLRWTKRDMLQQEQCAQGVVLPDKCNLLQNTLTMPHALTHQNHAWTVHGLARAIIAWANAKESGLAEWHCGKHRCRLRIGKPYGSAMEFAISRGVGPPVCVWPNQRGKEG
jgi:hypothetical protein